VNKQTSTKENINILIEFHQAVYAPVHPGMASASLSKMNKLGASRMKCTVPALTLPSGKNGFSKLEIVIHDVVLQGQNNSTSIFTF
jgi:hypothetical protein